MFRYKVSFGITAVLIAVAALGQAPAKPPIWDELADDAASSCGKPKGFGALSRLPSVRILVYDPVSNSFGFIRCTAGNRVDAVDVFNEDYLDRERLALTTQKIRLLILPYNARTTHLTLTKSNGHGVEFKALFSQPTGATEKVAADATKSEIDTTKTTPPENKADAGAPKNTKVKTVKEKQTADRRWATEKITFQDSLKDVLGSFDSIISADQLHATSRAESVSAARNLQVRTPQTTPKTPDLILADVSAYFDEYRDKSIKILSGIDSVKSGIHCLHDSLAKTDGDVTKSLALLDEPSGAKKQPFSLAYDRTVADLLVEMESRHAKILNVVNKDLSPCVQGVDKAAPFEDQVGKLDGALDNTHQGLNLIGILLDKASDSLANIRGNNPKDVTTDEWKKTIDAYSETLKSLRTFHGGVQKQIDDARTSADALLSPYEEMIKALQGPASWIQRFVYPPLQDNESLNLAFQRTVIDPKATASVTVDETNSIELRSASSDALRFSTGVLKSGFSNPTFKAGPTEPKLDSSGNPALDSAGKPITQHQILFDDESNGTTLMGVFVHHYWERRSPLLRPTLWERVVPTLSLGLPISKSDPLDQVLLGLDWELIPGVEFNVGGHFGKSARLVRTFDGRPLHVGDYVPATVDSTAVQSKHYSSGLYFGLSLNGDAFAALAGNRK